jgi:hypothetical protein
MSFESGASAENGEKNQKGLRNLGRAAAFAAMLSGANAANAESTDSLRNTEACAVEATQLVLGGVKEDLAGGAIDQALLQQAIDGVSAEFFAAGTSLEEQFTVIDTMRGAMDITEEERSKNVSSLYNFVRMCEQQIEAADFYEKAGIALTPEMEGVKENARNYIDAARGIIGSYGN